MTILIGCMLIGAGCKGVCDRIQFSVLLRHYKV